MKLLISILCLLISYSFSIRISSNVKTLSNTTTNMTKVNNTKSNMTLSRTNQFDDTYNGNNIPIEIIQIPSMKINKEEPSNKRYPQPIYPANHLYPIHPGDKIIPRIIEREPIDVDVIHQATVITPVPIQQIVSPNQNIVNINNSTIPNNDTIIQESIEKIKEDKGELYSIETEKNTKESSKRIILKKNYYGIKPKTLSK